MNLNEAEAEIAAVLRQLEKDTDCIVEEIHIQNTEVTQIQHDRPQLLRRIIIELRRQPAQGWYP